MTYSILKRPKISFGAYALMSIREQDMENIRQWRNAQLDILRQREPISLQQQQRYWSEVVAPSFDEQQPSMILVSFMHEDTCIGYGGLVHIDWPVKRAEVSFLLDPAHTADEEMYKREFGIFLELLKELAFKDLGFNRLFTETFDIRPFHVAVLEKHGFVQKDRLRKQVNIQGRMVDSLLHECFKKDYE